MVSRKIPLISLLALSLLVVPACSSGPTRPGGRPQTKAAEQEANELRDIQQLYSAGAYEGAIAKLSAFEKKYPRGHNLAQAHNLHGLAYLLTKKPLQAIYHFKESIKLSQSAAF